MASENKKKKAKNSYCYRDKSLKGGMKIKRVSFYNASTRKQNKRIKD